MLATLALITVLSVSGAPTIDSVCLQVAPAHEKWTRTPDRKQAAILIHGYYVHVLDKNVAKPQFRAWQKADAPLVKELGKNADVFVFAYGQNASLDSIVNHSKLAADVKELRKLGYSDIVLVGHSAGGLIARHFVEDYPDAGVTKVVQLCSPNGGSPLASLTAPKSQKAFLQSLTTEHRKKCLELRCEKKIPDHVQFICVIAKEKNKDTDGVVPCVCQWTADLQKQGIPAICVTGGHRQVLGDAKFAATVAELINSKQGRWPVARVEMAKKEFFGK